MHLKGFQPQTGSKKVESKWTKQPQRGRKAGKKKKIPLRPNKLFTSFIDLIKTGRYQGKSSKLYRELSLVLPVEVAAIWR